MHWKFSARTREIQIILHRPDKHLSEQLLLLHLLWAECFRRYISL